MSVLNSTTKFLAFYSPICSSYRQHLSGCQAALGGAPSGQSLNYLASNRTSAAFRYAWACYYHRKTDICMRGCSPEGLDAQFPAASGGAGISLHSQPKEKINVEQLQAHAMARQISSEVETIQVLDMEEYFSEDAGRVVKFCENLRAQCHTVGFFYVRNHGIPQELCDSFLQLCREFFDLPSELKMQLDYRRSAQFRGYMKVGEENTGGITDFREQLDLGPEDAEDVDIIDMAVAQFCAVALAKDALKYDGKAERLVYPVYRRLRGPNQWPPEHLLPDFKPKVEEFINRMGILSMHLMQAIALSLGLSKDYFDATFQNMPHYQMKIVRYPPKSENEDTGKLGMFGVGEHSDSGFLSLLLQDAVGGLQAQTNAGEWTDVPPKIGTFVVNLGEMLQLATGGYYLATVHRVQSQRGTDSRYSVPFFFNPRLDTDITALSMVAKHVHTATTFQNVTPVPLQDNALGNGSKTHGGANQLLPVFGQNAFKSFARSHPYVVREHHADLLQFGKLMLSKVEEVYKHPQERYTN